ncbi:SWIM zinc finger family protein [Parenemella sanctibonifatiensis]|uniref:SWIM-type domain-containing protein n=1 Tax=Parenemella sanctibonifatiensis TaxID=2016505 RepID=A0A255EHQ9_9ACTN|nr:SWIM zinc finger family protein [Parenemella sanctibonifatiensis]OYN90511.1 hypothetical protein CGZ92_01385 [Parenemella sanctibonifatiensis]
MTGVRTDLMALTEASLIDLTNRGTVRRATRELDQVQLTIEVAADGTVTASGDDDTVATIPPDKPFGDWTCSCLAAVECRHLVRAVLAYQREAPAAAPEPAEAESTAMPEPESELAAVSAASTRATRPADLTDEELKAVLPAATMRRASELIRGGVLGHVGASGSGAGGSGASGSAAGGSGASGPGAVEITVARIVHPTPVSVRFLVGADLNYVRCSCRDPDPCVHVPIAVALLNGKDVGSGGLRSLPGDTWLPDQQALAGVRPAVADFITIGAEASQRSTAAIWSRLLTSLAGAELHHVTAVITELRAEIDRYANRATTFDPSRLVRLTGELLARHASLTNPDPDRVPDRLVAGPRPEPVNLQRATFVGLGTELTEVDEDVRVVGHVVDVRSTSRLHVIRHFADPDHRQAHALGNSTSGGQPVHLWGGGQTVVTGGRTDGAGEFSLVRQRASAMPGVSFEQIGPPVRFATIADLTHHQTGLPAILDDRSAGADLAICQVSAVEAVWFDSTRRAARARLLDADGAGFDLEFAHSRRKDGAVRATLALLARWAEQMPEGTAYASGRWHWRGAGPVLDPFLLAAPGVAFQPHVAKPVDLEVDLRLVEDPPLTTIAALIGEVDRLLGEVLVAGLDRIGRDPSGWRQLADAAARAGSSLIADLARDLVDRPSPDTVCRLLLLSAVGGSLI